MTWNTVGTTAHSRLSRARSKGSNWACEQTRPKSCGLTWLPDALRSRQGVTEDALVPQAPEPVDDAAALVQHRALHLVLVGVRTPVAGLRQQKNVMFLGKIEHKRNK